MKNKTSEITVIRLQRINDDKDIKWIISQRSLVRFLDLYFPKANGNLDKLKGIDVHIEEAEVKNKLETLKDKELDYFTLNELPRYQKKKNSDYLSDIKKARDENDSRSLLNLLEWDKAWLKMNWVADRILQGQDHDDFEFLKSVGKAIAKQPGCNTKPMSEKNSVRNIKLLFDLFDIRREDHTLIRDLHSRLIKVGIISDQKADYNYFGKWLKRHRII